MIVITLTRDHESNRITTFHVTGHALYDEPGKDIVCAGVSAVTFGTVNAVEVLLSTKMETRVDNGDLMVKVSDTLDDLQMQQVQLLLESMIVMLDSIKQSYSDHVQLRTITR